MPLVKLSSVRQLILPLTIPKSQILSTKKISWSNSNLYQEVTATQASHQNHKKAATDSSANLNNYNQNFSVNHLQYAPKEWFEQLQPISVSVLNGGKAFDTYSLIDPGSQFTFILGKITEFLPCEDQEATTLQYLNTEHDKPLSKIYEQPTVELYENLD